MAGLSQSHPEGQSLWTTTVTFTPSGTESIPATTINATVSVSIYVGYAAYYTGRAYGFDMVLNMSNGSHSTSVTTYPDSNRGNVTANFTISNTTSSAITVSSITLRQTSQFNSTYIANARATTSNSFVTVSGGVTPSVGVPGTFRINNATSHTGKTAPLTWTASSVGGVSATVTYEIYGNTSTLITTTTSLSYTVPQATAQNYTSFRIRGRITYSGVTFYSGYTSNVTFTYNPYSNTGAPTTVSLDATQVYAGQNTVLRWSGASAGDSNPITGYLVQRSVDNSTWSNLQTVTTTATSGNLTVTAHATMGSRYYYRIRTNGTASGWDSGWSSVVNVLSMNVTQLSNPTNVTLNRTVAEVDATMSWTAVANGTNNAVTNYLVTYQDSENGTTWGASTKFKDNGTAVTLVVTPPTTRGHFRRFFVQAQGAAGASFYSGTVQANRNLMKNILPVPPTNVDANPFVDPGNGAFPVTFMPPADPYATIASYEVAMQYPDGSWFNGTQIMGTGTASPVNVNNATWARGNTWHMFVRTVDIFDLKSSWSLTFAAVYVNDLQAIPSVSWPVLNGITFNRRPRIGITLGNVFTGRLFSIGLTFDSSGARTNGAGSSQFSRIGSQIPPNTNTVFQVAENVAIGTHTVSNVLTNDGIADLISTSRPQTLQFSINTISWTDPVLEPGITRMKAVHVTEIRSAINTMRRFYGMLNRNWSEALIAGQTNVRAVHIQELRDAVDEIRTFVNGFHPQNTTNFIPRVMWTDASLTGVAIKAQHINELRTAVVEL